MICKYNNNLLQCTVKIYSNIPQNSFLDINCVKISMGLCPFFNYQISGLPSWGNIVPSHLIMSPQGSASATKNVFLLTMEVYKVVNM